MKSKRAKEFIIQYGVPPSPTAAFNTLPATTATALVELAEEDARERAVKAYCSTNEIDGWSCQYGCKGIANCESLSMFLKAYDNEE